MHKKKGSYTFGKRMTDNDGHDHDHDKASILIISMIWVGGGGEAGVSLNPYLGTRGRLALLMGTVKELP